MNLFFLSIGKLQGKSKRSKKKQQKEQEKANANFSNQIQRLKKLQVDDDEQVCLKYHTIFLRLSSEF